MQLYDTFAHSYANIKTCILSTNFQSCQKQSRVFIENSALEACFPRLGELGAGGEAIVYKTQAQLTLPALHIIAGDHLALRQTHGDADGSRQMASLKPWLGMRLDTFDGLHISDYLTKYYLALVSRVPQDSNNPSFQFLARWRDGKVNFNQEGDALHPTSKKPFRQFWEVIELVDVDLGDYLYKKQLISDSMVFEWLVGEWAVQFYLQTRILDNKLRNYGLKHVDAYRMYHIDDTCYCFPPGYTMKRLDIETNMQQMDSVSQGLQEGFISFERLLPPENFETKQGYSVLSGAKTMSVFMLFKDFFQSYQRPPPAGSKVKEYWVKPNPYLSSPAPAVTAMPNRGISPIELTSLFNTILPSLTINESITLKHQLETYIK